MNSFKIGISLFLAFIILAFVVFNVLAFIAFYSSLYDSDGKIVFSITINLCLLVGVVSLVRYSIRLMKK